MESDRSASNRAVALVVDDHEDTRTLLQEALANAGYPTVAAASGKEALEFLRAGLRPSVVIVDLLMPEMDGWELIPAIRRLRADVALVSMTAGHRLLEAPVSAAYLQKPFHMSEIIRVVARLAGPPRAGPALG